MALFGVDFADDRIPYTGGSGLDAMYVSQQVATIWGKSVFPMGHTIGSVTFDSAAYIGRYITKRMSGVGVSALPLAVLGDGELVMPEPEFLICSKGIGASWFDKYFASDVYPHGRVITAQGVPAPVPRYYKDKLSGNALLSQRMRLLGYKHQSSQLDKLAYENQPQRKAARATVARVNSSVFVRDPEV